MAGQLLPNTAGSQHTAAKNRWSSSSATAFPHKRSFGAADLCSFNTSVSLLQGQADVMDNLQDKTKRVCCIWALGAVGHPAQENCWCVLPHHTRLRPVNSSSRAAKYGRTYLGNNFRLLTSSAVRLWTPSMNLTSKWWKDFWPQKWVFPAVSTRPIVQSNNIYAMTIIIKTFSFSSKYQEVDHFSEKLQSHRCHRGSSNPDMISPFTDREDFFARLFNLEF